MVKIKQTKYEAIPVGEYPAKIASVLPAEGDYGPQLKVRFELLSPGCEGKSLAGWCSQSFSPKSKLWGWTKAALGREIAEGEDFDSEAVVGKVVRLTVVTKAGDNGEYNKIADVKPARPGDAAPVDTGVEGGIPDVNEKPLPF